MDKVSCPVGEATMLFMQYLIMTQDPRASDSAKEQTLMEYSLFMLQKKYIQCSDSQKVSLLDEALKNVAELETHLSKLKNTLHSELESIDRRLNKV